jgi:hypothetical protein
MRYGLLRATYRLKRMQVTQVAVSPVPETLFVLFWGRLSL